MSKITIQGSKYSDTDLSSSVCSHLEPILDFLEKNGSQYDHVTPMETDKGGGATRRVKGSINFDLIENVFDIPEFIKLNRKEKALFCTRCWCDIVEG